MGLLEIRPHVSYNGFWDYEGFQETGVLHVDTHWEWRSSWELHTGVNFTREGVKEAFEIYPDVDVSPGTYDNAEAVLALISNQGAPVAFEIRSTIGGFFGGDRLSLTPNLRFRIGDTFNAELGWAYNDIDLPEGAFTINLGQPAAQLQLLDPDQPPGVDPVQRSRRHLGRQSAFRVAPHRQQRALRRLQREPGPPSQRLRLDAGKTAV